MGNSSQGDSGTQDARLSSAGQSRVKKEKVGKAHLFPNYFCREGTPIPIKSPGASGRCPGGGQAASPAFSPHQGLQWTAGRLHHAHLPPRPQDRLILEAIQASGSLRTGIQGYRTMGPNLKRDANPRNASLRFSWAHATRALKWKSGRSSTSTDRLTRL